VERNDCPEHLQKAIKQHVKAREKMAYIYNLNGVYHMACKECPFDYIGQTGHTFRTRYKEHIREMKTNGHRSKFDQHILDTAHNHDTIEQTMEIPYIERKGKVLNALESYHIYRLTTQKLQMNEALTDTYNPIYILIKTNLNTHNPTHSRTLNPPHPTPILCPP
jgi:hypothetical protein